MCVCVCVCVCVFFQAEDGIRDLVRSRGLGDVYKRQAYQASATAPEKAAAKLAKQGKLYVRDRIALLLDAVSYTHLTLPTSDLV